MKFRSAIKCLVPDCLLLIGLLLMPATGLCGNKDAGEVNNGQDFTKPVHRLDLRYRLEGLPDDASSHGLTIRGDYPVPLGGNWTLALRADLPLMATDVRTPDNLGGHFQYGAGDLLTQAIIVRPLSERYALGVGGRFIWPVASEKNMGTGKFQFAPAAGLRIGLDKEITKGSFVAPVVLYSYDFAGDSDRSHISEISMAPIFNVNLPDMWFATLYPNPEIKVNLMDDGALFLPIDIMVGKMLTKSIVASVEVSVPIINDYKVYDAMCEFRIGFFF